MTRRDLFNVVSGENSLVPPLGSSEEKFSVRNPATGEVVSEFGSSDATTIERAVHAAMEAKSKWSRVTAKQRAQILFKFRSLCLDKYKEELIETIMLENGKHKTDATASFLKGIETCEYALSPTSIGSGTVQEVSSGITCQDRRDPLGIIVSICPFNFPAMVPMWTVPILVACGNCVIVKPSEKVPFTITRMVQIMHEAGLPNGVVQVVHGGRSVVRSLITHKHVDGVTFVGSSPVAEIVYRESTLAGKRALCLGGAKNHTVIMPDAGDIDQTATDILNSFAGSAGQRCMAVSVLIMVEDPRTEAILEKLVEKAKAVKPGQTQPGQIGPVIDQAALDRITKYVSQSESKYGNKVLVDGRTWSSNTGPGFWFGPTIIDHKDGHVQDPCLVEEIFGPVLSVFRVKSLEEAISRINVSEFGNAASIYTQSGYAVEVFTRSVHPGMIGVNIGVPVPREPFSFGGTKRSKFGIGDITGDGLIEFGTVRRKITTKWVSPVSTDFVAKNFTG
jgi:malonate-semialdehyde dehydrogenase (acetylating)/methylmalonate-semialdehyde dehydrogenase